VHAEDVAAVDRRPLTPREKAVLDLLLSVDYPGVNELREQAGEAVVVGTCDCGCPTFTVAVPADSPRTTSNPTHRTAPVELRVRPVADEPEAEVILFLDDGRISSVEYVSYQAQPPADWPTSDRLVILDRRETA
jgi:hypothetical protein